jgi:hypothetical protein
VIEVQAADGDTYGPGAQGDPAIDRIPGPSRSGVPSWLLKGWNGSKTRLGQHREAFALRHAGDGHRHRGRAVGASAMVDARQLVDHIRRDLKPLDDRILRHPYLEGLEAGRLEQPTSGPSPGSNTTSSPGQRFLVNTLDDGAGTPPLQLVVNWPAALRK